MSTERPEQVPSQSKLKWSRVVRRISLPILLKGDVEREYSRRQDYVTRFLNPDNIDLGTMSRDISANLISI